MKFGFRKPSLKKKVSAKTSGKRKIKNSLGLRAPKGKGWITNPKKASYNKIYNKTSKGCMITLISATGFPLFLILLFIIMQSN